MGLLSGLEAQSEISELLDELCGDDPRRRRTIIVGGPWRPGP
jgi:hypothetical protein